MDSSPSQFTDSEHSSPLWRQRQSQRPSDGGERPVATWIQTSRHSHSPKEITKLPLARSFSLSLQLRRNGQPLHSPSLTSTLAARVCSQSNASAMAKTKQGKRDVEAYTIKGTNKVVRGKLPPRPCS